MYEITPLKVIDFGANGNLAILQNAQFLLSSVVGTCYMDRKFGRETPIDDSTEQAKAIMIAEIIETLGNNIPEIQVEEVNFEEDPLNGKVFPRVKVVINDGKV
ncbi:hypothetical protein [Neobacillus mesonae]|uniref:hypothetical protein n=1 Tax=Neobacillus mesonae TaxID=1193713 RepID=UPI00203EBFC2|nr:hypothetical protein [Neobacillus mesonae]MCM3567842.1 hypothetical protein [Neobacillus mesonae]